MSFYHKEYPHERVREFAYKLGSLIVRGQTIIYLDAASFYATSNLAQTRFWHPPPDADNEAWISMRNHMLGVQNRYRPRLVMPYNDTRGPNRTIFGAISSNLIDYACGIACQKTDTQRFCELLQVIKQRITPGSPKPYHLVLDNHSCHDSKETRQWLYDNERDTFKFLFTVPGTPQFNSIECLWPHIRRNVRGELA
jgi:hypothetical protein